MSNPPYPSASRAKRRLTDEDDDGEETDCSLQERPAQMARMSSPGGSDPPLIPLALSANTSHVMEEIAQRLDQIKEGKDPSTTVPHYLGLCLRAAAKKARTDLFHRLLHLEGLEVNDVDLKGTTAMMLACQAGCEELVKLMLGDKKFNPSLRDKKGNGLINYAMKDKNNLGIVRLLLTDERIDVNMSDENGDSLLLLASGAGSVEFVSSLLESPKIKVNKRNDNGDSPLMCAANEGNSVIVDLLLKRKEIDVNSANTDRVTSLMCAADKGFVRIVSSCSPTLISTSTSR